MKLPEVVELVENHPDLHLYLDKILKKNKKTQVSYLESLNHLAYLLYLDGQEEMAKELLDRIIQVPFEGNYNTWTFVDSSLVLLAYMEREKENQVLVYKKLLLSPLEQGEESTQKIRRRVHQRFLNGDSLEQKLAKIGHCTHKMRHKKTLLLKSGKIETGVFCYGQKSIFSRN